MHRWIKAAAISALGVATLGAAPQTETATVTMGKGYDKGAGLGAATVQQYFLLPDGATCHGKKQLAVFSMFSGKSITKPVPAGALVNIYAGVERANAFGTRVCQNNVTFTPVPGHDYTVLQRSAVWKSCNIEVTDTATNQPPADLNQDNSVECIKVVKPEESK